jgi:hypothetical protein
MYTVMAVKVTLQSTGEYSSWIRDTAARFVDEGAHNHVIVIKWDYISRDDHDYYAPDNDNERAIYVVQWNGRR